MKGRRNENDPSPQDWMSTLATAVNAKVLSAIENMSAHSDNVELLRNAVRPLGDVQLFCPDWHQHRWVVAATQGVIFGLAVGMNTVAFRFDSKMRGRALQTGGVACPEYGPEWVAVVHALPDSDWPSVDVPFWARKSYAGIRER